MLRTESEFFQTPVVPMEGEPLPQADFVLERRRSGVFVAYHPMYVDGPMSIGDGNSIKSPIIEQMAYDAIEREFWQLSNPQLSLEDRFRNKPQAATISNFEHQLGILHIANRFGASPAQFARSFYSDWSHKYGRHIVDDAIEGRGQETFGDHMAYQHLVLNGTINALTAIRLLDKQGRLAFAPVFSMQDLLDPRLKQFQNFLDRDRKPFGIPDADCLQYLVMEAGTYQCDPSLIPYVMQSFVRVHGLPHNVGDALVATNLEAAEALEIMHVRAQSEIWSEPVDDLLDELSVLVLKYAIVASIDDKVFSSSSHPWFGMIYDGEAYHAAIENAVRSGEHPFLESIYNRMKDIAHHQRQVHKNITTHDNPYRGPVCPEGLTLQKEEQPDRLRGLRPDVVQEGNRLALRMVLLKGKDRRIDPLVYTTTGIRQLTAEKPSMIDYMERQGQWIGNYTARITVDPSEATALRAGLQMIKTRWHSLYEKGAMSPELYQELHAGINNKVKNRASVSATHALRVVDRHAKPQMDEPRKVF